MVGGFKNDAQEQAGLYRERFTVPSVHIIGRTDTIIPPHESRDLADQFANPLILQHSGGHWPAPTARATSDTAVRRLR